VDRDPSLSSDARLHNLRHFYATVLISSGYDIDAVSKALGHSSVAITSLIYTALFNAAKAAMAANAEALVWKDRAA
jgi:integrase